ncbi:MAG: hypothetical protein M9901_11190 [Lentimicrobium sp.]|nr:hypothetical protein [Lentimicrobium sp.]
MIERERVAAELKQASFLPPPASAFYQQASRHSDGGGISTRESLYSIRFLATLEMTGRLLLNGSGWRLN